MGNMGNAPTGRRPRGVRPDGYRAWAIWAIGPHCPCCPWFGVGGARWARMGQMGYMGMPLLIAAMRARWWRARAATAYYCTYIQYKSKSDLLFILCPSRPLAGTLRVARLPTTATIRPTIRRWAKWACPSQAPQNKLHASG
jgi:hypothetical protein